MSQRNRRRHNQAVAARAGGSTAVLSRKTPAATTIRPTHYSAPKPSGVHHARVASGVPTGGQFAPQLHDEATAVLAEEILSTPKDRREALTDQGRYMQRFPDIDAFEIRDGEIIDVDPEQLSGRELSSYLDVASYGYDNTFALSK